MPTDRQMQTWNRPACRSERAVSLSCFPATQKNPSAGSKHRRLTKASRKAGLIATVSARALIVLDPILASVAQDGIRPQRATEKGRSGIDGSSRIIPQGCDGAML